MSFTLSILVIVMLGIWSVSQLLVQEKHTYTNYKGYEVNRYKADAVQEVFIYQIKGILDSAYWTVEDILLGSAVLVTEQDSSHVRDFFVSNLHYKQAMDIQSITIPEGYPLWFDGTCSLPPQGINDLSPKSLCARLDFTVDGISRTVFVKVNNIIFGYDSSNVWIEGYDDIAIADIN